MLALWREWKLDAILRKAWIKGVILAGISAGAICWFEQGLTDSVPGRLSALPCLGFLPGSCCPHYDGEAERCPTFHRLLIEGEIKPGLALEDGAAAHFVDDQLSRVVSSRPNAKAYMLKMIGDEVQESPIESEYLSEIDPQTGRTRRSGLGSDPSRLSPDGAR
jgi:dipeptidase E